MTRISPSNSAAIELKILSAPANVSSVRRTIETFCSEHGLSEHAQHEVGLCVNEALANVIRHAYAGDHTKQILVSASDTGDSIVVKIRDWGSGRHPGELPCEVRDPSTPGGLGLFCLRQMMDKVEYTPQPDGMLLTLTKRKRETGTERSSG